MSLRRGRDCEEFCGCRKVRWTSPGNPRRYFAVLLRAFASVCARPFIPLNRRSFCLSGRFTDGKSIIAEIKAVTGTVWIRKISRGSVLLPCPFFPKYTDNKTENHLRRRLTSDDRMTPSFLPSKNDVPGAVWQATVTGSRKTAHKSWRDRETRGER